MKLPMLLGWSVGLSVVAACGCARSQGVLAAEQDLLGAIARAGSGEPEMVSRAQKPEPAATVRPVVPPLDTPPDRTNEVINVPAAARIRVTVNGEAILDEEIKAACYQALLATQGLPEPERNKKQMEVWYAARDQLIDREVVLQDMFTRLKARKETAPIIGKLETAAHKEFEKNVLRVMKESANKKTDEEFKDFLRSMGVSLQLMQRQYERQFMAMEYLRNRVWSIIDREVNHPAIIAYYESHPEEFTVADSLDWQDLFIDASRHPTRDAARRFAEVLVARARMGQDFAKLAEQFDNGDSSLRDNAAGIGHKHGEIQPTEAEAVVFKLKEGEVGPLIELPTGYHVVRIVKRTTAGQQPFDDKVQKAIRDKLRNEIGQREMKRLVTELKRKAIIEYSTLPSGIQPH